MKVFKRPLGDQELNVMMAKHLPDAEGACLSLVLVDGKRFLELATPDGEVLRAITEPTTPMTILIDSSNLVDAWISRATGTDMKKCGMQDPTWKRHKLPWLADFHLQWCGRLLVLLQFAAELEARTDLAVASAAAKPPAS